MPKTRLVDLYLEERARCEQVVAEAGQARARIALLDKLIALEEQLVNGDTAILYPCPVRGCRHEFATQRGLGIHRNRTHGSAKR